MWPRSILFALILCLVIFTVACPKPNPEPPHAEADIGQAGGVVTLDDAAMAVRAGALPSTVEVELVQDPSAEDVELDENETPISDVFTVKNDQNVVVDSAGEPFSLTLPFDPAALPAGTPSEAQVFVKMETDEDIYTLVGTIAGNAIEVLLYGLPYDADFQVVYNPNAEFVLYDTGVVEKRLTQLPPWEAFRWAVHLDATNSAIRTAVGTVLSKNPAEVTRADAIQVIRERISRNANEVTALLQAMGLRQPNIPVRTREDGKKRLVLNLTNQRNSYENPTMEEGVGQLHISCSAMAWEPTYRLGAVRGVIAHELFHASVNGYDLKMGRTSLKKRAFTGYNEGMATVVGHTIDKGGVITVRENTDTRNYTLMLNQPLGIHDPRRASYTNNDFFAYVGKRYGAGSMAYVTGVAGGDGYQNGVLGQMRKFLDGDPQLLSWASELESYLMAYRIGLHNALTLQFATSLADAYWDFARNRAYENNAESRLRTDDSATQWELRRDRFESSGIYEYTFTSDDKTTSLTYQNVAALKEIPPMATRALVFNGSGFEATLTLSFETFNWLPDTLGNAINVKVYVAGQDGTQIDPENAVIALNGFGKTFTQVVVLISNVAVDGPYSIQMQAKTEPYEEPGPCAPDEPYDRWLIQYDFGCDDTWLDENLWHFQSDGTISDHWLGEIHGYSWAVVDNKMVISFGPDSGGMEATFSEDCSKLENGTFVGGVNQNCWKAERY